MIEKTQRAARFVVLSVSLFFLLVLSVLKLFANTYVAYDKTEKVQIVKELPFSAIGISVLILIFFIGIVKFYDFITNKSEMSVLKFAFREEFLYLVFCGITLVAGTFLIFGVGNTLREDPLKVYDTARQFAIGDYRALQPGGYIFHKAHQLGLVTYERILGCISFDVRFHFFLNLVYINGINFLTFKLADLCLHHNSCVNLLTICLSYLFLPQFFFVVYVYGLVPGFFFLLLGVYFLQRYFREGKAKHWIIAVLAVTIAALLKSNYLIGAIAMTILCILQALKQKKGRLLVVAVMAVALPIFSTKMLPVAYQVQTGEPVNAGEPMITYIAMGVNPLNESTGPGWYDGSNYTWYLNAEYDYDLTVERAKECLQNCIITYKNEPVKSIKFFVRKTISQWCDPLFQSIWSGPMKDLGQTVENPILRDMYLGEGIEPLLCLWMKGVVLLIYLTSVVFLWTHRKKEHGMEYAYLFFIGGFLFHLVWEAKSQYIYPYVFVMIPACAYTIERLIRKTLTFLRKIYIIYRMKICSKSERCDEYGTQ